MSEREEVLNKLAEYEYPEWCNWVSIDGNVGASFCRRGRGWLWRIKPSLKDYEDAYKESDDGESGPFVGLAYGKTSSVTKSHLYTIEEINQRKEEMRTDLKEWIADSHTAENHPPVSGTDTYHLAGEMPAPILVNRENREQFRAVVQRNIQAMMPNRRIERDCKDCIYYKYNQCAKYLTNNGYCEKFRKK